jgi:hypothetical protein
LQKQATSASNAAEQADKNLALAKRSLADIEQIDATKKHLTVGETIQLRNAQEAVTNATQKAAEAHQKAANTQEALQKATTGSGTAVAQLSDKLKGQAAAAADTFTGHLKAIKTEVEDQAAKFGQKYGPALQGAGAALTALGTVIKITTALTSASSAATDVETASKAANTATTDASTAAIAAQGVAADATQLSFEGMAAAETTADVAALPMIATIGLIVLAVAALVAIGIVIYKNWSTIWGGIKDIVKAVWDWIRNNWPLLLGILLGPFGLAVGFIIKYRQQIWDAIKDVWNWITKNWPLLLAILTGPFGLAVLAIIKNWNSIVNFFTGIPGDIRKIFDKIWGGIVDAFKAVINAVIDIWNKLHFTLPKVSILGVHIGGETIGVPQIPHLAQGGLITSDGLIYAHAGEAITPIDKVPRGPAVNIEHAHFNSEVDVDLFMRRAAWVVQTAGV